MMLMKLTDQGIKDVREAPARYEGAIKAFEQIGGKVIGFWIAIGRYDYVSIGEATSDEAALAFSVALGSLGNVRVESVKLINKDQFTDLLKKLPKL